MPVSTTDQPVMLIVPPMSVVKYLAAEMVPDRGAAHAFRHAILVMGPLARVPTVQRNEYAQDLS
jgi:hypothetical protein